MKKEFFSMIACPECQSSSFDLSKGEVGVAEEGSLVCQQCKNTYPIISGIPRFVDRENYAQSFGFQWNKHAQTQIDTFSGSTMSRDRFFGVTQWARNLAGEIVLEAGSGSGRFTQIVAETGAEVYTFDYSIAVDANYQNNRYNDNVHFFQGDIYKIPLKKSSFDKVFCLGVLQHCPEPHKAFLSLLDYVKPGGEITIDVYDLTFRAFVNPKYWLRPFTTKLSVERLYGLVQKIVPKVFPIKMWITEKIPFGKYPAFFIPVAYHKGFIPQANDMPYEQLLEWSILDTFDKFAPRYDKPQTIGTVKKWFRDAGVTNCDVRYGPNGIVGRGVKP